MAFKILGVDHIGIACKDLQEGKDLWTTIGLACTGEETVAEQKVTTTFHPTPNGSEIELLVGTADDSPDFACCNHHICLQHLDRLIQPASQRRQCHNLPDIYPGRNRDMVFCRRHYPQFWE